MTRSSRHNDDEHFVITIPNIARSIFFVLCLGLTVFVSNSVHWLPSDSFAIVEGSGRASFYISFVPFWSEAATFRMTDNRLIVPMYTSGNTLYRNCTVTYDIDSAHLFAETFGTASEFTARVTERLGSSGTVDSPTASSHASAHAYNVTDVRCDETADVNRMLVERYCRNVYFKPGDNEVTVERYLCNETLYVDCVVQYRITSMTKFFDRFVKDTHVFEVAALVKRNIMRSLERDRCVEPEYTIIGQRCREVGEVYGDDEDLKI